MKVKSLFDVTFRVDADTMSEMLLSYAPNLLSAAPILITERSMPIMLPRQTKAHERMRKDVDLALGKTPIEGSLVGASLLAYQVAVKGLVGRKSVSRVALTKAVKAEYKRSGRYSETSANNVISSLIKEKGVLVLATKG